MLTVLMVEDDADYAAVLSAQLEEDGRFGELALANSLADARSRLATFTPDLAVLDLGLPDGSGAALLAELPATCQAVVLTVFGDEAHVLRGLADGARGYLLKEDAGIPDALYAVAQGAAPINRQAARHLLDHWQRTRPVDGPTSPLSSREQETLEWLAEGCQYREVAQRMSISTHTVSDHVKRIYRKLAVNSRASAVHKALQLGYLNTPRSGAS